MRPVGMPVQSCTTAATALRSTDNKISGVSPCASASTPISSFSRARSASGSWESFAASGIAASSSSGAESSLAAAGVSSDNGSAPSSPLVTASSGTPSPRRRARSSSTSATISFSLSQRSCAAASAVVRFGETSLDPRLALGNIDADRALAADDALLDLQRLPTAHQVLDLGRPGMLRDGDTSADRIQQAHGLVWQSGAPGCSDVKA